MFRTLTFAVLVSVCFLPAGATITQAQKPILLRYRFKQSQTSIYQSTQTTKQTQTAGEKKIEIAATTTEITSRTLERIDKNKNLQIRAENKQLNVKVKIDPTGEYVYDSKSDENETDSRLGTALTPMYDLLKVATLREIVSPRGSVVEIRGYEELMAAVLKENAFGTQFSAGGTNKSRKVEVTEFYPVMSKGSVKPGDTWEEPFEVSLPKLGTASGVRKYKFAAYDKVGKVETAKITYTTEFTFKLEFDEGGQKASGEISIKKSSGVVQFDPKMGRVVNLKSEYSLAGDIKTSVNGRDRLISMQQSQAVELKLLDKLPPKK